MAESTPRHYNQHCCCCFQLRSVSSTAAAAAAAAAAIAVLLVTFNTKSFRAIYLLSYKNANFRGV
jgi:hypothetical protein